MQIGQPPSSGPGGRSRSSGLIRVFDDRRSAVAFAKSRGKGDRVVVGQSEGTKAFLWSESENAKES